MSPLTLLLLYCLLIALASWLGGYVPLRLRLGHTAMQALMSAVAGFMFGVALLHMLGHALPLAIAPGSEHVTSGGGASGGGASGGGASGGGVDAVLLWLLAGFLVMFFTERFFAFHVHDTQQADAMLASIQTPPPTTHTTPHTHHTHCDHHDDHHHTRLSWTGATVGMTIHSLVGGVALGSAVAATTHATHAATPHAAATWAGLPVFLAIVLHKPLDALTIIALAKANGLRRAATLWLNFAFAFVVPAGALLAYFGLTSAFLQDHPQYLAYALAFSAGTFICIALSDLLPEVQFHQHDRAKLSAALLLGLALAYAIGFIESTFAHHR